MDNCFEVYKTTMDKMQEMRRFKEQAMRQLRACLYEEESSEDKENVLSATQVKSGSSTSSTKRQRLSALKENEEILADKIKATSTVGGNNSEEVTSKRTSQRNKSRVVEATSTTSHEEDNAHALESTSAPVNQTKSAIDLMPPPATPVTATTSDQSFSRPQRAAKLNCEKHLKEPKLNSKMRREADGEVHIKLEQEQRASQMHETTAHNKSKKKTSKSKSNASIASTTSQDSVIVLPSKALSIVTLTDQSDQSSVGNELENASSKESSNTTVQVTRAMSLRIKREKMSEIAVPNQDKNKSEQVSQKETSTLIESSVFSTTTTLTAGNTTSDTTQTKKSQRKKKTVPKPIKVERLSDVSSNEPKSQEAAPIVEQKNTTVYEEAVDNQQIDDKTMNNKATPINNETITVAQQKPDSFGASKVVTPNNATMVLGSAPNDATYCTAAASTFVIDPQNPPFAGAACSDLTFDVNTASKDGTESQRSSDQSMATARDTLQPRAESLITEDESDPEKTPAAKPMNKPLLKMNTLPFSASKKAPLPPPKSYKMPVREIFNPLIQSPVKKKVEAFESMAAASTNTRNARSKLAKENKSTSSSTTTPLIGKLPSTSAATASNRYLTPTQSMITANAGKKVTASASKALGLTKSHSADKIWTTSSAKAPSREHSAEDFRRGTSQLAEERKKQRDQRHLLAAQQREAKERERAERLAKAAKEREEQRLKKQQLAEQKQRELQEIRRKLKQQEEAQAAAAAAEIAAQKEKLAKISASGAVPKARMLPPQPKTQYTFEMLHEDDSTDDEGKVTYKRPPPPTWSLSHVRGPQILAQEHAPKEIVDSFFSVQPRTLDLQMIFPKIDPRHLKRNSSAIWQTPPRYSELPKY